MNRVIEMLREKFGGSAEGASAGRERTSSVSIPKGSLVRAAGFLIQEFDLRFLFLFASDERKETGGYRIRYVFSYPREDQFLILGIKVEEKEPVFPSLTPSVPQANWQEREVQDLFGLTAEGHPDPRRLVFHEDWPEGLYPLRKDFKFSGKIPREKGEYPFEKVKGEGVFEVPVGPVHAGIIEPGHFRFSSAGESILKLEIRHFYTHKGIEKLGEGKEPGHLLCLAERISGDNSLAHAMACVQAIESLSGTEAPRRAQFLRVIFLELERLHNHVSDIAGVALDVAFGFGAAQLMRIKERLLRLNERLTGTRLLRSILTAGGVRKDLSEEEKNFLLQETEKIKKDFDQTIQILWNSSSFLDRIEETGVLRKEIAEALGGTGPVAKASGVDRDLRRDHPYAIYSELLFLVPVFGEGDVESRLKVKIQEIYGSIKLIHEAAKTMPEGPVSAGPRSLGPMRTALGYSESPRGECFHWLATDREGKVNRWKIQSPSFANWPLMEYAVLENIVPDFPVINKSMNLSYSGNDR